ncbi:MAG: hypothetical protein UHO69_03105 [Prevotella sp.]|nr:hypothetical protein [Prevotella sp.]
MTKNEIVGRLRDGGLDASSTNRSAAVYVADAREGRAAPGWFAYRIICDSDATERRARGILSRWYDIEASGNVWRLRSRNRVPLMAIKRGGVPPTPPTGEYMYFEAVQANSTVSLMSTLVTAPDLEYSTDGETWQEWQHTTADGVHTFDTITLTAVGDKVWLRGDNPDGLGYVDMSENVALTSTFSMTGKINGFGNMTSLLDGVGALSVLPPSAFPGIFVQCSSLLSAPSLKGVRIVGESALMSAFGGCEQLETPSDMSDVEEIGMFGCQGVYESCSALSVVSSMPNLRMVGAASLYAAYKETAITEAMSLSNVTAIGQNGCTRMFVSCGNLVKASDMPNVTSFGQACLESMYTVCDNLTLISDGVLTFSFPALPVSYGNTTLGTAQAVADEMEKGF